MSVVERTQQDMFTSLHVVNVVELMPGDIAAALSRKPNSTYVTRSYATPHDSTIILAFVDE